MSHGGDEEDMAAQAWPGFVDVLSSTLIMFVFFLMVTAIALAFHTMMFKSKIIAQLTSQNEQKVQAKVESSIEKLSQENKELKEQLEQVEASKAKIQSVSELETKLDLLQQSATLAKSTEQKVTTENENTMVIFYGPDAISITDDTQKTLDEFMSKYDANAINVSISGNRNTSNAIEEGARRVAVARMLNLRNVAIKYKVPPQNITASIISGEAIDGKSDWVKIKVEMK